MQIVIEIDEDDFKEICMQARMVVNTRLPYGRIAQAILHGTPLPKGHGRLKDVDDLNITTITTDDYSGNEVLDVVLREDVDNAPTIIEADKESEEEAWQISR